MSTTEFVFVWENGGFALKSLPVEEAEKLTKQQSAAHLAIFGTEPEEEEGAGAGIVFENGEFKLKAGQTVQEGHKAKQPASMAARFFSGNSAKSKGFQEAIPSHIGQKVVRRR